MRSQKAAAKITFTAFLILTGVHLIISCWAVWYADKMASMMVYVLSSADKGGDPGFDVSGWKERWLLYNYIGAVTGLIGVVSAGGMLLKKQWARILWTALITTSSAHALIWHFGGLSVYAFEEYTVYDLLIYLFIITLSIIMLRPDSWNRFIDKEG